MLVWIDWLDKLDRSVLAAALVFCALFIGLFDYLSGAVLSFALIYAMPVATGAWFIGARFALILSALSTLVWLVGDLQTGDWDSPLVPIWNGSVRLSFYSIIVVLLTGLHNLQRNLESRIRDRATALTKEIMERQRLERELLRVSDREQRRIGADLHDGLCQHLTGTALAGEVLAEKLAARALVESGDARRVVALIEEGISLSRNLASGLNPVDMEKDGLMHALDGFAANTSDLFKVSCEFECAYPVLIYDPATAAQMYRIAQEAVGNAIKHGQADRIVISLDLQEDGPLLRVEDNGVGLPEPIPVNGGMGLRIMAHRAKLIGAAFDIRRRTVGGTIVSCALSGDLRSEVTNDV